MTTNAIFRNLWRFNAVMFAGVGVMAFVYGVLIAAMITRDTLRPRNVVSVAPASHSMPGRPATAEPAERLEPQGFSRIPGHDVMYAALASRDTMSGGYYSKEAINTRDYVFYDLPTGRFRRLIGRDDVLVPQITFLGPHDDARMAPISTAIANRATASPVALFVTLIDKDSNGDGRISTADRMDVVMADPAGRSPKSILTGIDRLIGHTLVDEATAVLFVRNPNRGTRAVRVSLASFTIERDDAFAPSSDR